MQSLLVTAAVPVELPRAVLTINRAHSPLCIRALAVVVQEVAVLLDEASGDSSLRNLGGVRGGEANGLSLVREDVKVLPSGRARMERCEGARAVDCMKVSTRRILGSGKY
jgi:hypothetical protein